MDIYEKIKNLADKYASDLKNQVDARIEEMKSDDTSHYYFIEYWELLTKKEILLIYIRTKVVFYINMLVHF